MKTSILMNLIRLAALSAFSLLPGMAFCTYSASSPQIAAAGGFVTMQVYTQPGCFWQVFGSNQYMRIYPSGIADGRGNGVVTWYVSPTLGPTRTFPFVVTRGATTFFKGYLTQHGRQ